jgi:polysaccharide export outer membrane protein
MYNTNAMKTLKSKISVILLSGILALCLCPGIAPAETTEAETLKEYEIGPENALLINVYYGRDKNLERKVRVSADGFITFPLLGKIEVVGLTVSELANKLTYLLGEDYLVNPQVSVFIEEYSTVSILGQVNDPGSFEIKGKLTVVELISMAGGFTKIADTNNVKVIRTADNGSKRTIPVRVNDIINKGKEESDIRLKPNDIVTVGESFF